MQDPRLKPFVAHPPAEKPTCTIAALWMMPGLTLLGAILLMAFSPAIIGWFADAPHNPYEGCRADPVQGAKLHILAWLLWTVICSSLAGLLFLWFATEREEPMKHLRKTAFFSNSIACLLALALFFFFPEPINSLSQQHWLFLGLMPSIGA